jgi:hypothetical protein
VRSFTVDAGWHPQETIALTGFYTKEQYDSSQAGRAWSTANPTSVTDPGFDWSVDTRDKVDTWNLAITFSGIGKEQGWNDFDFGLDYTYSDTRTDMNITAGQLVFGGAAPVPQLQAEMQTFTLWGRVALGEQSSFRLSAESSELATSDWALDGVAPDTLANVLLLGQGAANYDLWLISGAWTYRF